MNGAISADTTRHDRIILEAEKEAFAVLAQGQALEVALEGLLKLVERLGTQGLVPCVWVLDGEPPQLRFCAGPSLPQAYRDAANRYRLGPNACSCGSAVYTREPVVIPDVTHSELCVGHADLFVSLNLRAAWSTPIFSPLGSVIGTFAVYYPEPHEPRPEDRRLIERITQTTALLIERHRADEAVRAREAALSLSQERLQRKEALLDVVMNATDVMLVYLDPDFNFVWVNQAYAQTCRMAPEDMIGHNHFVLYPDQENEAIFRRARDTGEPVFHKDKPFEFPDQPDRGVTYWDWSLVPVKGEDGHVTCLVFSLRETTPYKRAQIALAESEERFSRLVKMMPAAIYTCDRDGRITFYNERAADLWGRTPMIGVEDEKFCGAFRLYLPDGSPMPHSRAPMAEAIRNGTQYRNQEVVIERPDGRRSHVLVNIDPIKGDDGTIVGAVNIFTDISELKGAGEALRAAALFPAQNPAPVLRVSGTGMLLHMNPAAEHALKDWDMEKGHPVPRHMHDLVEQVMEAKHTRQEEVNVGLRNYLVSLVPIVEEGYANLYWHDITDRKRAEQALRESEERFRTLADHMSQFAWMADATGSLTWYNRRWYEFTGTTFDEMQGWGWQKVHHPRHLDRVIAKWKKALETGKAWEDTFPLRGHDGRYRWFLSRALPIRDTAGHIVRWFGTNTDVTELRQVQEELRESEERLRSFAGQLEQLVVERTEELVQSQERLRALATELNLAEQRERKRLAAELHDHLQQMLVLGKLKLGQGKRLAQAMPACVAIMKQTDDVLTDALKYTRTLVAELSPPVLREHGLAAGLKWLAEYMTRHDMTVTVQVTESDDMNLPEDQAILLFQSVRELLINASKHAGSHEATVMLERAETDLRIEVRDKGVGFDLAAADSATGLSSKFGLFSIRERMKALEGSFEVKSASGQGTTAILTLPLRDRADGVSAKPSPTASPCAVDTTSQPPQQASDVKRDSSRAKIRVLLVDDHAMVRQGLRSVLESYPNIEVVGEAWDGEEAIMYADSLRPTVIVMDINMPKMNGIDATARIKHRYPDMTVIGLSVNASEENRASMTRAGAALLMTKEAAVEQLYSAIQGVVRIAGTI